MRFAAGNHDHASALFLGLRGLLQVLGQAARIAAGRRLANRRTQPFDQAVGGGAEMHLGHGLAAGRIDRRLQLGQILAELVGVLRGAPDRHVHDAGHARQAQGIGHDDFMFKNHGHQADLVIDQHKLGVVGI